VRLITSYFLLGFITAFSLNGQNAGGNGRGIPADSSAIGWWAKGCIVFRGPVQEGNPELGLASSGNESNAIGKADNNTVSLGDSGIAVVSFPVSIRNIPGADFAVFENSFDGRFLELAFVEVSSDSIRWVRFPSSSFTSHKEQVGSFGILERSYLNNLAGIHPAYFGTPFDLSELLDSSGVDINMISFVKVVDVKGNVNSVYPTLDSFGNIINDPWPTPWPQGGFDLDAVAVLKEPGLNPDLDGDSKDLKCFPNPAIGSTALYFSDPAARRINLRKITGELVKAIDATEEEVYLDLSGIENGIYLFDIREGIIRYSCKLVIL
jgi:hypothetical protein